MGNALPKMDLDSFLAWENEQPERHEFVRGEVFAMVGARRIHNLVAGNVFAALKRQLKGSGCQAFIETAKVLTEAGDLLYPDVFVTCDSQDLKTDYIFRSPSLVVEILSPATQAYDRSLKFRLYRRLASLREYVLIDPETREVQLFRLGPDQLFALHDLTGATGIEFTSIGCSIGVDDVFEGAEPAPAD